MKTISHDEFVKKYLGRYVEYADPTNMYQCTDLMRQYIVEVLGLDAYTLPRALYAKNIFNNFKTNQYYRKILNTANNMPKKGDIMFFKTSVLPPYKFGMAGHVGIVNSADVMKLVLLNQNYPTKRPCELTMFNYKDALGWIRKV